MCGIYLTNFSCKEEQVRKKLNSISFRGPDNLQINKVKEIILGHLRLAILDLDKRSNQPYSFEQFHIVFNGEIYNFKDIREELISCGFSFETTSDTEVLIKGYAYWGKEFVSRLNGMFAFAIYDEVKGEIFCARDRLGVKPFFYYWKDGAYEICSQLRPLVNKNLQISKEAVSIYLDCGYIPSPLTIFEDVFKLQPGHTLSIDLNNKTKKIEKYWDLKEVETTTLTYGEAKEQLHALIINAVKIRMQADVPLGSFLSGGIDSALVSAIAAKHSSVPINTFTIAFEDPKYDESKIAQQYASIIGSNHKETLCNPEQILQMLKDFTKVYDEPFADSSALPSLLLNKITKDDVTVALSGDGGDESFIGYWHLMLVDKFKKVAGIPFTIRKALSKIPYHIILGTRPETLKGFLSSKDENELIVKIFTSFDSLNLKKDYTWVDKYYPQFRKLSKEPLQRAADFNIKLWLENDSNVKVDRASMAFSVESRSPFLDYRIIEFARTLPISYRFKNGVTKRIIRDILKEYIPEEVFTQPKKGFAIPLNAWIRGELKDDILSKLNDAFLHSVPNLDVLKFKKQLGEHLENKYDYSFSIWKLYILALWCEEFNISF
ncbi:asparagine synthase (glutamine-hydrolyzing) [Sphingobacterium spiritivorum]|uniref:asparagine synthase (glutamine-hydrolyzing) n=1 Tax=Sphingobacterium spiritivorum ATCC 33861 TaxID=525373 RepID=D7VI80_SPHSI|nr:asparagine synthase (glutamine-hydrolyzing) [Sphingobacterium spiritivorum]EFK59782.1 asparagine synthase (glutamine-hydrolyzing) [Sphingobacterium spiritivorum ATCC 33861]QQT37573.1 asparagine synthase (glutamine-hydrolyzing) [Sphingobacterium spiritivorum]WQD34370.1 asparagine synthase (glutamine-hydrolyzing) [Sphingobacterium spiritivorum]SUI97310.1 Asparagine synthetase [glutamine-hydrolyzing] 1 [Sphingobacterium spiritivorum]